jgi:hypothetical protein
MTMSNTERADEPHLIRLRAAWEAVLDGARVNLPVNWPIHLDCPFEISRRFNAPRIDPRRETARLRFESVPGLVHARLNDIEIVIDPFSSMTSVLSLDSKNLLVLTIDPAAWRDRPGAERDWGHVAIVIEKKSIDLGP